MQDSLVDVTPPGSLTRRTLLTGLGAGAGLLLVRGLAVPRVSAEPGAEVLLRELVASFTSGQRERILLPLDHPTRQLDNTLAVLDRPHLGTLLSRRQLALVRALSETMLSERGLADFAATFAFEGRFEGSVLAIYGDPGEGPSQAVISGGHFLLRGGSPIPGTGFGGPIAYGQQIGNQRWKVRGNAFAPHGDAANQLYAELRVGERRTAVLPEPPSELLLQLQGEGGRFPGVRIGSLSDAGREAAAALLDTVFGTYPEAARREALSCIEANGGSDALHFATYATKGFYPDMQSVAELDPVESLRRGDPYWQVWRLEGPGTVIFFKGHPHVHAYVHVSRDPARGLLGETLASVDRPIEGDSMRRLLEAAIRRATGEPLAWHPDRVPGRFCPGTITSGLAYTLDPYRNRLAVATLEGRAMAPPLRDRLTASGTTIEDAKTYRVATLDYFATRKDLFGDPSELERTDVLLRDALVAHLRAGTLEGSA